MGNHYTFFLGKKYADGTIDYLGEEPIIISRYSEYVLSENFLRPFDYVSEKQMREKLKDYRNIESLTGKEYIGETRYITFKDFYRLNDDYIKSGYFLCEDVNRYLKSDNKYDFDGFYDRLDPIIYSSLVRTRPETIVRDSIEYEGEKEILRGANDYMWFAYPDYDSDEYQISRMSSILSFIQYNSKLEDGEELVILEKEDW